MGTERGHRSLNNTDTILLEDSIQKCQFCSLGSCEVNVKHGKMYGFGNVGRYVVLGQNPSINRDGFAGYAMSKEGGSNSADWLWKCLEEVRWDVDNTYFTNVVKCSTPDNRDLEKSEYNNCSKLWLSQELLLVRPHHIICLGKNVYDYITNMDMFEIGKCEITKVYHHAYIARKPSAYEEWLEQWKNIRAGT